MKFQIDNKSLLMSCLAFVMVFQAGVKALSPSMLLNAAGDSAAALSSQLGVAAKLGSNFIADTVTANAKATIEAINQLVDKIADPAAKQAAAAQAINVRADDIFLAVHKQATDAGASALDAERAATKASYDFRQAIQQEAQQIVADKRTRNVAIWTGVAAGLTGAGVGAAIPLAVMSSRPPAYYANRNTQTGYNNYSPYYNYPQYGYPGYGYP